MNTPMTPKEIDRMVKVFVNTLDAFQFKFKLPDHSMEHLVKSAAMLYHSKEK